MPLAVKEQKGSKLKFNIKSKAGTARGPVGRRIDQRYKILVLIVAAAEIAVVVYTGHFCILAHCALLLLLLLLLY